jgi:hypothetical protein
MITLHRTGTRKKAIICDVFRIESIGLRSTFEEVNSQAIVEAEDYPSAFFCIFNRFHPQKLILVKVIVQDARFGIGYFNNDSSKYIVDRDTYSYFLHKIYEKMFGDYVYKRTGLKRPENFTKDMTTEQVVEKTEKFDSWDKRANKYHKRFHKERAKFYLYNDKVYSYTFIGEYNVGHVIEIVQWEIEDIPSLLNTLLKKANQSTLNKGYELLRKNL